MAKIGLCFTLCLLLFVGPVRESIAKTNGTPTKNPSAEIPLYFIENQGQFPDEIKYYSHSEKHSLFFTTEGLSLFTHFPKMAQNTEIRLFPLNAKKGGIVLPEDKQQAALSYFYGNRPENWHQDIASYRSILYEEIYDGIDMRFYGNQGQLAYDLIVAPGADPSKIQLAYEGLEALKLSENGTLEIILKEGLLRQKPPYVYQEISGRRVEVRSRFRLLAEASGKHKPLHRYGFQLGTYDKRYPLIIDPTLDTSSYLGGTNNDFAWAIVLDNAGNAYIAGETWSSDFPLKTPLQGSHPGGTRSAFVAKIDLATSTLLYATYLGGSGEDIAIDIAVDASGAAYVIGHTDSVDFPTALPIQSKNGGEWDVFVAKLGPDGTVLEYSTYLGGFSKDYGRGIAVDTAGGVYLTGETLSQDFPTAAAIQGSRAGYSDAFVTKINASGSYLDYSTYLGGSANGTFGDDFARDIAVDATGAAYVTGKTNATDFPTVSALQENNGGLFDAFITKINPAGTAWHYSSYLGGSHNDAATGLALEASGNVILIGETLSLDFPTVLPLQSTKKGNQDFFIAKLKATGDALQYATYLGGIRNDVPEDVTLDTSNNIYITGWSQSSDFPTLTPMQNMLAGNTNIIALKLNAAGTALIYSTYLGTGGSQIGAGIAVDAQGTSHIVGWTDSSLFPMVNPVQGTYGGGSRDGILLKISHPLVETDITVSDSLVPIDDLQILFAQVTIGTSSTQRLTISNDGGSNLVLGTLASTDLLIAPFSLINDKCSGQNLSPASQCTVDLRFSPTNLTNENDSFDIPSNDPDENPLTFTVSGTGSPLPAPDIRVIDNITPIDDLEIAFGDQTEGTTADQTVTILNTGNANLKIGTLAQSDGLSAPFSLQNNLCDGQLLAPSSQCTFVIRFSPTASMSANDSFDIPSDDADESSVILNLSGQGLMPLLPNITVSDSLTPTNDHQLPFGNITLGNTSEETLNISNTGNANLRIGTLSTLSAPFAITNNACSGEMLPPASTCLVSIRFSPLDTGLTNASFKIFSDDPDENQVSVSLSGTGLDGAQNNPPDKTQLLFPANAQENVGTSFDFEWTPVNDPDGDPLSYDLYYCRETNPLNCDPIQVVALSLKKNKMLASFGMSLFVFGIVFIGRMPQKEQTRKSLKKLSMILLLLSGTFLIACSSGGGGGSTSLSKNQIYRVSNLEKNSQYFWTVIAKDGRGGVSQSAVWTFKTQ